MHTCVCVRIYGESQKVMLFFRSTGIITTSRIYTIPQNEAGPLWITSLLLNIVTVSCNSNVLPSNESMYPCLINSVICSLSHFITGIMLAS